MKHEQSSQSRGSPRERVNQANGNGNDSTNESPPTRPIDPFFTEREEARIRASYTISYLEEKALYMRTADSRSNDANSYENSVRRQLSLIPNRFVIRPRQPTLEMLQPNRNLPQREGLPLGGPLPQGLRFPHTGLASTFSSNQPHPGLARSNSHSDLRSRSAKVLVQIHRHLLDQHLLGRPSIDDRDGMMTTAPISLSADFFHPVFTFRPPSDKGGLSSVVASENATSSNGILRGEDLQSGNRIMIHDLNDSGPAALGTGLGGFLLEPVTGLRNYRHEPTDLAEDTDSEGEPTIQQIEDAAESIFEPMEGPRGAQAIRHAQPPSFTGNDITSSVYPFPADPNILMNVDLEIYSASSSNNPKLETESSDMELRSQLRTRFAAYQRCLEMYLSKNDSNMFDECLLDFWDEFLPQTCFVHYYDRHTPVPRISCLHKFLTNPCPKAIGVVQCEIERIKLGPKKKGVSMKGRFFPTYEYRLFIRHHQLDTLDDHGLLRRDTVLMVAKNRGRKHVEASSSSAGGASKKGANNYFLYSPQREDVDQHFKSVNGVEVVYDAVQNGASNLEVPTDSQVLLGRLQSNFIGTEFQIFTPRQDKKLSPSLQQSNITGGKAASAGRNFASDEESGYDSGLAGDNFTSRRKGRFGRFPLRRSGVPSPSEQISLDDGHLPQHETPYRPVRRSRSSGDMNESRRMRTSRRAIANNSEADTHKRSATLSEVEDGAITYTANLLGSRPRIMDVCIPKVSPDGLAGAEWKQYIETCMPDMESGTGNRMLNHLKQIQQRVEIEEQGRSSNQVMGGESTSGTYIPPDDFGLLALQNRPPWWNIELGSFVLNFGGRVSVASVKNFQLCDRNDQDYIMLQFGRIQGRHSFTMDFQHPLTAVQAFAIAISSLQSKISFG